MFLPKKRRGSRQESGEPRQARSVVLRFSCQRTRLRRESLASRRRLPALYGSSCANVGLPCPVRSSPAPFFPSRRSFSPSGRPSRSPRRVFVFPSGCLVFRPVLSSSRAAILGIRPAGTLGSRHPALGGGHPGSGSLIREIETASRLERRPGAGKSGDPDPETASAAHSLRCAWKYNPALESCLSYLEEVGFVSMAMGILVTLRIHPLTSSTGRGYPGARWTGSKGPFQRGGDALFDKRRTWGSGCGAAPLGLPLKR
jgi:hypothetical protein